MSLDPCFVAAAEVGDGAEGDGGEKLDGSAGT